MSLGDRVFTRETCHCGRQVVGLDQGDGIFTRGLCASCDEERCDAPQDGQRYSCHPFMEGPTAAQSIDYLTGRMVRVAEGKVREAEEKEQLARHNLENAELALRARRAELDAANHIRAVSNG